MLLVNTWNVQWWQALNPVSWSLACEAFFYAVFPLLFWILRGLSKRELTALAGLAVGAVFLMPWVRVHQGLGISLESFPLARLPEFVLGAAMARLVRLGAWRGPGLDVAVAITVIGYFLTEHLPMPYGFAACTVLGYGLLVPAAAVADLNGTPSFWRKPWLVRLGEWSFAFYMIHLMVMRVGEQLFVASPQLPPAEALAATTAAFLVCLGLAFALYRLVEVPGRRLIIGRSRRRAAHRMQAEVRRDGDYARAGAGTSGMSGTGGAWHARRESGPQSFDQELTASGNAHRNTAGPLDSISPHHLEAGSAGSG